MAAIVRAGYNGFEILRVSQDLCKGRPQAKKSIK